MMGIRSPSEALYTHQLVGSTAVWCGGVLSQLAIEHPSLTDSNGRWFNELLTGCADIMCFFCFHL